jgi:undecaprenyl-diphosphatase
VRALLRYIGTHSFAVFAWYRIAFGVLIIASASMGWIRW